MLAMMMALGLFLMLSLGLITIVGSTKYKKNTRDNVQNLSLSRYCMNEIDKETYTRDTMSETLGPLYGLKRGNVIEGYGYENFKGETVDMGEKGAKFKLGPGEIQGPPEGMEEIGYVHGHRDRPTPEYKVPDELKDDWERSSDNEKRLFPSKQDAEMIAHGKVFLITSPRGDYRPWTRDTEGHIYSPGFAVKTKEE